MLPVKSKAYPGAGPRREDRVERAAQRAIERLVRSAGEQLGRDRIDILDQRHGIAPGGVASEGNLVLLGEIDAEGRATKREEIMLIADLGIEEVRRQLFAQRVEVARIAHAARHREADAAVMQ